MFHQETLIPIEDPEKFQRSSPDYAGLLFNRNYPLGPPYNVWIIHKFAAPSPANRWDGHFRDPFVSVIGIQENYSPYGTPPISFNFNLYVRKSNRIDYPEDPPFPHTDHAGAFFQFQRRYAAQLVGYTFEYPDFCDHPWLEWVHPKASDEAFMYPFRQIYAVPIRGQQFNLFFNQPKPWWVDGEYDTVNRKPETALLVPLAHVPAPFPMPNLIGLQVQDAINLCAADNLLITNLDFVDTTYPILPKPRGTVIFQQPPAGTPVLIQAPVVVICSSGLMNLPAVGDSVATPVNVVIGPNTLN